MMPAGLSVIIPAYNEEASIRGTLVHVSDFLARRPGAHEILIIDDGSADRTREIVKEMNRLYPAVRLIRHARNSGKGKAVRTGVAEARYAHCLFMDADGSTSIDEWPAFERAFAAGARAVQASRHLPDSHILHPQPLARQWLGTGYRILARVIFGLKVSDFNCGSKAYETDLARAVYQQIRMTDWSFYAEVMARLAREGVVPVEVPVRWAHKDKRPAILPITTALKTAQSLWRLCRILASER